MTANSILPPFPTFLGLDGFPLDAGYIYIGEPGFEARTTPKASFFDIGLTVPTGTASGAAVRTLGGYPARNGAASGIYVDGDFSIAVTNKSGVLLYSSPSRALAFAAPYNGPWLDTVADLVADTSLTYTAAQPGTVAAGDYVQTRSEGIAYQVATSGAVNHHLITAGGVKLYVMPGARGFNVLAFGAKGDGVANDTAAIQAAIGAAMAWLSINASSGSYGFGHRSVYVPTGSYRVTASLLINSPVGFTMTGDGQMSSLIILDSAAASATRLFFVSSYLRILFSRIGFRNGVLGAGTPPTFTVPVEASRNNNGFSFDSSTGGTDLTFDECEFTGFDRVFQSTIASSNGDHHRHDNCSFRQNNYVWENSNNQAVIWSFTHCKYHFNRRIFYNPGVNLTVFGGDGINPGDFYTSTGTNSLGGRSLISNLKFENYQNINSLEAPRWLVLSGTQTGKIVFENCDTRTGSNFLTGKESASLAGTFDVEIIGGFWDGNFNVNAGASVASRMSALAFRGVASAPEIVQTLVGGQGSTPINLQVDLVTGQAENYAGLLANSGNAVGAFVSTASFRKQATINANANITSLVFLPRAPYEWLLGRGVISYKAQNANLMTVTIWADSTKAVKIWETTVTPTAGVAGILSIEPSAFTNNPVKTSASTQYALEFSSALNMGLTTIAADLTFIQAARL